MNDTDAGDVAVSVDDRGVAYRDLVAILGHGELLAAAGVDLTLRYQLIGAETFAHHVVAQDLDDPGRIGEKVAEGVGVQPDEGVVVRARRS